MGVPFRFELLDGEAFEEVALAKEVGLHGGEQEALAETSGTAGKVGFTHRREAIDEFRLVHVHEVIPANVLEALYADGHFAGEGWLLIHGCHVCFLLREVTKNLVMMEKGGEN